VLISHLRYDGGVIGGRPAEAFQEAEPSADEAFVEAVKALVQASWEAVWLHRLGFLACFDRGIFPLVEQATVVPR